MAGEFNGEFNWEQQMMVRLLRTAGVEDPEAVVRGNLVAASYFGAFLAPALAQKAAEMLAQADADARAMLDEAR